jgi:hypothetical protein
VPPFVRPSVSVRVSRVGARDGESFVSPSEHAERIRSVAAPDNLELVETIEELDVGGGAALAKRAGLRPTVEMVEAGDAQVVVVAYFDRLVRALTVPSTWRRVQRMTVPRGRARAAACSGTAGVWAGSPAFARSSPGAGGTSARTCGEVRRKCDRRVSDQ